VKSTVLLAALLAAGAAEAQMYKCLDARGITQYSDKPCPGGRGKEVDIRGQPPISGKLAPQDEDLKREEREFQRRQGQRERDAQAEAKADEQRRRKCASLQGELRRLGEQRRIASVNAQGERVFVDDATRERRMEQLRAEIARNCA
jgi:hypothetical protein